MHAFDSLDMLCSLTGIERPLPAAANGNSGRSKVLGVDFEQAVLAR